MRYLTAIIVFCLILAPPYVYGKTVKGIPKIPFEGVFNPDSKDKFFVVGTFKEGTPVLLLAEKHAFTCLAETTKTELYDHPTQAFQITNLKIKDECTDFEFVGALIGVTKAKYRHLKLEPFKNDKISKKIFLGAQKYEHPKCPDYLRITNAFSILWVVPNQKEIQVIAQLKRKSNQEGPLFIYKNNRTYALEGGCAHWIKTFSINDRIYLKYTYSGCDNGQSVILVYDLSGLEPCKVYSNDVWST